jgi:hypothetical protein
LSCGCHQPLNDHGKDGNITLPDLQAAAEAAGISPVEAANNIVDTVADILTAEE